jgi:hypothetical protein
MIEMKKPRLKPSDEQKFLKLKAIITMSKKRNRLIPLEETPAFKLFQEQSKHPSLKG